MGLESPSHWAIIALVALVLFGYKKLPEMSRSVGRSLRIFKTEVKGMSQDDAARDSADAEAASQPQAAATPVAPAVIAPPVITPPVVDPAPPVVAPASPVVVTPAPVEQARREA
jgi:sec-independent protein translocase protein TatA